MPCPGCGHLPRARQQLNLQSGVQTGYAHSSQGKAPTGWVLSPRVRPLAWRKAPPAGCCVVWGELGASRNHLWALAGASRELGQSQRHPHHLSLPGTSRVLGQSGMEQSHKLSRAVTSLSPNSSGSFLLLSAPTVPGGISGPLRHPIPSCLGCSPLPHHPLQGAAGPRGWDIPAAPSVSPRPPPLDAGQILALLAPRACWHLPLPRKCCAGARHCW